jgi:hypothetical protein
LNYYSPNHLKNGITKITLIILFGIIYSGCNAVKNVPEGKQLLTKNNVIIDGQKKDDNAINELLTQKPNSSILGYKLRLNLYNMSRQNADSAYKAKFLNNPAKYRRQSKLFSAKQVARKGKSFFYSGIHKFLQKTGEAPAVIDETKTQKSLLRIRSYYFNNGFFKSKITSRIDSLKYKRASITYDIMRGPSSTLDSISTKIYTPALDSLYRMTASASHLKSGERFKTENFELERSRLTNYFRNRGAFYFQQSNIIFNIDTVGKTDKADIEMIISDQSVREGDTTTTRPFKLYNISEVNIYTDATPENAQTPITDTVVFNKFRLLSHKKLKYRPKAITDAVFIAPGTNYSDIMSSLTTRYLGNLKVFNYPTIQYKPDPNDSLSNSLIANIILTPKEKYLFGASLDLTHSNIQNFGIAATTSLTIRNIFAGAETFEIAARGNIGSSKDLANPNDVFFNISEYGIDTRLNFPRLVLPFNTESIIPKRMLPSTSISLGFAKQQNIGLDKENFTGAMTYNWTPKRNHSARLDLFNIQYVNNINIGNYFNVYRSSYNALTNIAKDVDSDHLVDGNLPVPDGTGNFIGDVLSGNSPISVGSRDYRTVSSIEERRIRLSQNNLILASSYTFSRTTKNGFTDEDFYTIRTKLESAGNVLGLFARATESLDNSNTKKEIFGIEYSQYLKTEFEYVKHWELSSNRVFAVRGFFGIAVPYGNSESVPFSRSYFAGGSNDIRAWQPYSLGPGRSAAINDFNEANMKFTASAELRFTIVGSLKGGLFVDAGNIWNVFDDSTDDGNKFTGFESLRDMAVGSGFGVRYDFSFFVVRLDLGFKTYNPADTAAKKWFRDYNFGHSVLNIGINYPF